MLVLTHPEDGGVIITAGGYTIRVVVVNIGGSRVKIGYDAPAEVKILRHSLGEFEPNLDPTNRKESDDAGPDTPTE